MSKLEFSVFSGGTVTIDHEICATCASKACVAACNQPSLGSVLTLRDDLPALSVTPERAAQGGCIECLACDLACQSAGAGGLSFVLPTPELESYLENLLASGGAPGRGW
jgi:Fe-S-cluster-containing dehydrogenase component